MKSVAITDVGKQRQTNQDYVFKSDDAIGILPSLYIVADGMGGHRSGDYASRFCVEEFVKEIRNSNMYTLLGSVESALNIVNEKIREEAANNPDHAGMGTTFVCAAVDGDSAFVANIGDSRLYRYSPESGLRQITTDHSLVENMVRNGEIDRKEAVFHPQKNVITRALGAEDRVVPDFYEIDIERGDILLLCSDGLSNMVDDEKIEMCLSEKSKRLESKAKELVVYANERGGKDNISVILIGI